MFHPAMTPTICLVGIIIFSIFLFAWHKSGSASSNPLPPGPPADPFIGHLRIIPKENQGSVFHSWAQTYGDVMHVRALGRSFVILDSVTAATDLLEKKSSIYSDRPHFPVYEMMGFKPALSILPYGEQFRIHRKILHSYFTREACLPWQGLQLKSARELADSLLGTNPDYDKRFSWFTTRITTRIAYGFDIISEDDEYVKIAEHSSFVLNNSGPPGGTPVDFFPFLQYLPSWIPGTWHAGFARTWKSAVRRLYDFPFDSAQRYMVQGKAEPSLLTTELTKLNQKEFVTEAEFDDLRGASAMVFLAGSETTWSSLSIFLLTMILFPEAQQRAYEELDRVVGSHRLPEFSDFESLPYIECLVQEVLRWYPTVPLGIPHRCMKDDVYKGMLIPKGSMVIFNLRGMSLDESIYANPTSFNPSRFLPKPVGNGEPFFSSVFGFGRRRCPGRHLATASLWIAIATILATTKISKATDEHGKDIDVVPKYTFGIVSRPTYFPCKLQSRSTHAKSLLRAAQLE